MPRSLLSSGVFEYTRDSAPIFSGWSGKPGQRPYFPDPPKTLRGEIYLAALDPVMGREIAKTRPVAVVSNDKNNEFSGEK